MKYPIKMWSKLIIQLFFMVYPFSFIFSQEGIVPVPKLTGRVVDRTYTLTPTQIRNLTRKLRQLEEEKGAQIVVLLIPTTGIEPIEEFSMRVAEKWKIGRKGIDDGVILTVAKKDRRLRIEVGYGLEGVIPDAIAKRIIEEIIVPEFKKGKFYEGIDKGVDALIKLIKEEELPLPEEDSSTTNLVLFLGPLIVAFLLHLFINPFIVVVIVFITFSIIAFFIMGFELSKTTLALIFVASALGASLFGGSSSSGSFGGDGGFSGGGGSFGGGGASGSW